MKISLIAAATENNVIGKDNDLPWKLPDDMRFFVRTTKGHHILMGRQNFEATNKLLPNRTNIIITRQADYSFEGAVVFHSIEEGIRFAEEKGETELMIIGGGEIFKQTLSIADRIYLTRIHAEIEGDTYFPEIDMKNWKIVSEEEHPIDERHLYSFTFYTLDRK